MCQCSWGLTGCSKPRPLAGVGVGVPASQDPGVFQDPIDGRGADGEPIGVEHHVGQPAVAFAGMAVPEVQNHPFLLLQTRSQKSLGIQALCSLTFPCAAVAIGRTAGWGIKGISIPPMKPITPVLEVLAAIAPTRKEPSCSLKTTDWTFGKSTTASMMVNLTLGNSLATFFHCIGSGETGDGNDRGAACSHVAQSLFALRIIGDFKVAVRDIGFFAETFCPVINPFIKGLIKLPAHIKNNGRLELLGIK